MRGLVFLLSFVVMIVCSACQSDVDLDFSSEASSLVEVERGPDGADTEYTNTVHPVVLVHGLYGFKELLGIAYFYKVAEALELGGSEVYAVSVSALESTEERGFQLEQEVDEILAISGATKVNFIGHSHGGPTARYLAAVNPAVVASVTSVHGVNDGGSQAADLVLGLMERPLDGIVWQTLFNSIGVVLDIITQDPHRQNAIASFTALGTEGTANFNAAFPQGMPVAPCENGALQVNIAGNDIYYYSWGGTSVRTSFFDPTDFVLELFQQAIGNEENGIFSDGLVGECEQYWGENIRGNYAHNHLDAMNWVFGARDARSQNPLVLYRNQVKRLKDIGL